MPEILQITFSARVAEHADAAEVPKREVSFQGLLYVSAPQVAMADDGVRKTVTVSNILKPRRLFHGTRVARRGLNVHGFHDATALDFRELVFNQIVLFYRVLIAQNSFLRRIGSGAEMRRPDYAGPRDECEYQ
jgi:hypothetical protein